MLFDSICCCSGIQFVRKVPPNCIHFLRKKSAKRFLLTKLDVYTRRYILQHYIINQADENFHTKMRESKARTKWDKAEKNVFCVYPPLQYMFLFEYLILSAKCVHQKRIILADKKRKTIFVNETECSNN